ncbi:preprotein translocase subunit YajC [Verrucomicrobiales bacterium]|nr:preprotein translocase subunit YajC [Verrucomicrobiales bacterium]
MNMLSLPIILAQEAAPAPGAPAQNPLGAFLPMILIFVIFYFVLIRPQRKKQKELEAQVSATKIGDKAITVGGVHGLVANVKEKTIILKVADNVKMEFEKSAIQSVFKKNAPTEDGGEAEIDAIEEPKK